MSYRSTVLLFMLIVAPVTWGQGGGNEPAAEMKRLIKMFEGSYTTIEHHRSHEGFPTGGTRTGTLVIRPAAGGNAMVAELHSHSPQGDLNYTGVYWWDPAARVYRLLMCAKEFPDGCLTGATGHWEGDKCVRTREVDQNGKKVRFKDTIYFSPESFTNVAEVGINDAPLAEEVRTTATRARTK